MQLLSLLYVNTKHNDSMECLFDCSCLNNELEQLIVEFSFEYFSSDDEMASHKNDKENMIGEMLNAFFLAYCNMKF